MPVNSYLVLLGGYVGWGLFPLYWTLLNQVPALEVLLHRMLWTVPLLLPLVLISERRRRQVSAALANWNELKWLVLSSLAISFNWGVYIWAVANQRVVEASMGYFLTPLLNVLAGLIVFNEKLNRLTLTAVGFAAAGVAYYILRTDVFPWVGVTLGVSFAAYGLLRKQMSTNPIPGLFVEVLLLLPLTLISVLWLHWQDQAVFLQGDWNTDALLMLGGLITVVPLAMFTAGSRLLPMSTVGILFYVTPSIQFLSGIFILGEAFDSNKLLGFVGIWIGLALFGYHLLNSNKTPIK